MKNRFRLGAFWRRKKLETSEAAELETYLDAALHPIKPGVEFVGELRARLVEAPLAKPNSALLFQYVLLAMAGLLSSMIIIITGIRAVVTILGALGLLRRNRNRVNKETVAPAHTAI